MKTALVSGSAGFVGRHLCPKLEAAGYSVTGIDLLQRSAPWCSIEHYIGGRAKNAERFDVVVHCAANIMDVDARAKAGVSIFDDMSLDLLMCKYIESHPPKEAFIAMSSCAVDFSDDPYGWIKLTLEQFCKRLSNKGVPVVILRPFSGYGEDQSTSYPFRAILERALRKENPLTVWGGSQVRDWLHIDDLTDAIIYAIKNFPHGMPIEIGTGIGTNLALLAKMIAHEVGYEPAIKCDTTKATASKRRIADPRKAMQYGWASSISLQEGIRKSVYAITETAHSR